MVIIHYGSHLHDDYLSSYIMSSKFTNWHTNDRLNSPLTFKFESQMRTPFNEP